MCRAKEAHSSEYVESNGRPRKPRREAVGCQERQEKPSRENMKFPGEVQRTYSNASFDITVEVVWDHMEGNTEECGRLSER